jgi:hypothetical protein
MNDWPASLDPGPGSMPARPPAVSVKADRPRQTPGTAPVCIALSTYNGGRFLAEQLASFVAQSHANWSILWRDDGSTDETTEIMAAFARGAGRGQVIDARDARGRLGIAGSFLALVRRVPPGHIMAFADQDDVWLTDKVSRGVAALARIDPQRPALYCARQVLVDASLRRLGHSARAGQAGGFPQSLTRNIATGCTVMLNPAAVRLLTAMRAPPGTLHDWWAYLVVTAAGGEVLLDDEPTVLYRQHQTNAVGVKLSFLRRAVAAVRRGPGAFMTILRAHVAALEEQHDLLDASAQEALAVIAAALRGRRQRRLGALSLPGFRRQNFVETLLFRVWFLVG